MPDKYTRDELIRMGVLDASDFEPEKPKEEPKSKWTGAAAMIAGLYHKLVDKTSSADTDSRPAGQAQTDADMGIESKKSDPAVPTKEAPKNQDSSSVPTAQASDSPKLPEGMLLHGPFGLAEYARHLPEYLKKVPYASTLVPMGVRLGSGFLAQEGGVPGAAIAGSGEKLAQMLEGSDTPGAVATEAALGAVPFSGLVRGGKKLLSAARMAGYMEAGNMARRYAHGESAIPQDTNTALWDLGTAGAGGAMGGIGAALMGHPEPVPFEQLPFKKQVKEVGKSLEKSTVQEAPIDPDKPVRVTGPGGLPLPEPYKPSGLRVGPNAVSKTADELLPVRTRHIEEAAPAPGIEATRDAIMRRPSKLRPEQLDSAGRPVNDAAFNQELDDVLNKNEKVAEVQRDANYQAKREEQLMLNAEQRADLEQLRKEAQARKAQGTEVKKGWEQEAKNLTAAEKAQKQLAAQKAIDEALANGDLQPGSTTVTETTEGVPTASGKQVMRKTFASAAEEEDPAAAKAKEIEQKAQEIEKNTIVPAKNPDLTSRTIYNTEKDALRAAVNSGIKGDVKQIQKGKWIVVGSKAEAAAAAEGKAPTAGLRVSPVQTDAEAINADINKTPPPPEAPPEAPVPAKKAPKGGPKSPLMQGAPVAAKPGVPSVSDADVAGEVKKFTDAELQQAYGKWKKQPGMQAIVKAEMDARAAQKAAEATGQATPMPSPSVEPEAPVEAPAGIEDLKARLKASLANDAERRAKIQAIEKSFQPAVKAVEEAPAAAAPINEAAPYTDSYHKMAVESSLPPDAVKLDLSGAKDSTEISNRIGTALQKYRQEVQAAEDSKGVDTNGKYVYNTPLPKPRTIHVPGGPTYTFKPDLQQIDNAIQLFDKGTRISGASPGLYSEQLNPKDLFNGIVDQKPPTLPESGRVIKTNYGDNFNAKGGTAPNYKTIAAGVKKPVGKAVPAQVAPSAAQDAMLADTVAQGKAQAAKQAQSQPATAGIPTTKDGQTKAMLLAKHGLDEKLSPADLALEQQNAADDYFKLQKQFALDKKPETQAAMRLAGQKYGELKAANALAAKETGGVPAAAQEPAALSKPKGKGPTSDDLRNLPSDKQEAALKNLVDTWKKNPQKGAELAGTMLRTGSTIAGAGVGAYMDPTDPVTGALLGGTAGFYAPSVFRALQKHVLDPTSTANAQSVQATGDYLMDKMKLIAKAAPDYYRSFLLSKPSGLLINSLAGPYGSAVTGAIEHGLAGDARGWAALRELMNPNSFMQEYLASWDEAKSLIARSASRAEVTHDPNTLLGKTLSLPADMMTSGDVAARKILMRHGFSEPEAKALTLTSEPSFPVIRALGNSRRGIDGHAPSFILNMLVPFYRTNANQLEQSILRTPILGSIVRKGFNMPARPMALALSQQGVNAAVAYMAYQAGAHTPEHDQKIMLKLISNFTGVHGTTAELAFVAGAARRKGGTPYDQLKDVATRFRDTDLPLPTIANTARDIGGLAKALSEPKDRTKNILRNIPYGIVPPVLSSKEAISVPSLERDPVGVGKAVWNGIPYTPKLKDPVLPTKGEYSIVAPFADLHRKDLKEEKPEKSKAQIQMEAYRKRMNALRAQMKP